MTFCRESLIDPELQEFAPRNERPLPDKSGPGRQQKQTSRWLLEIVRGRDIGRTFALDPGETVVGNALNGQRGLDLLDQEGNSPRRMAARHATFACSGLDLSIQDLESPGGTFVNQQRLLAGRPRILAPGDVIQLGAVQLKVKQLAVGAETAGAPGPAKASSTGVSDPRAAASGPAKASPTGGSQPVKANPTGVSDQAMSSASGVGGRLPTPFSMANGAQCRNWDDFLILSAQNWSQLRDELVSGRLVEYLRRIGRPQLIPHSAADRSPDDRLDEWLARIPAAQSQRAGAGRASRDALGAGENGRWRHAVIAADHQRRLPAAAQLGSD